MWDNERSVRLNMFFEIDVYCLSIIAACENRIALCISEARKIYNVTRTDCITVSMTDMFIFAAGTVSCYGLIDVIDNSGPINPIDSWQDICCHLCITHSNCGEKPRGFIPGRTAASPFRRRDIPSLWV